MIWTKFSDKSDWYDVGPKGETCIGIFLSEKEAQDFLDENGFVFKRKQIGKDETSGSSVWHAEIKKIYSLSDMQSFPHPALLLGKILS